MSEEKRPNSYQKSGRLADISLQLLENVVFFLLKARSIVMLRAEFSAGYFWCVMMIFQLF